MANLIMEGEAKNGEVTKEINGKKKEENIENEKREEYEEENEKREENEEENEKRKENEEENEKRDEKKDEIMVTSINNTQIVEEEILDKYDIFSNVYSFSDDFEYIDSEESTSSKNLDDSKKKNVLSLMVHNIVNIYPNNEKNREFKKYKEKKLEEKQKKIEYAEKERQEKKEKKYEEKRKKKLEIYKIEKSKQKLVERQKYSKYNIEHSYLTTKKYYEFLQSKGKQSDICVSFHNYYISPMRLYYFMNINVDQLHYLDLSRKWLSDNYTPVIIELCIQKKVKCLNLSFNRFTYLSVPRFATLLTENQHLFSIDFESNNLTNSGKNTNDINKLFKSLENNRTLKSINIANTHLDQTNGEALCQLLNTNTTITEINMEDNNFTNSQYLSIIESIHRNNQLKHKQDQLRIEERERMSREETYMYTYLMALESSIIEMENKERRKRLNKMMYINMWRKEMREKELREQEILDNFEAEHQKRIKDLEKKKLKKQKKKK